ncbi:hypothetical protein [Synechococcus sp. M16CYN]|uniref:hypothetical protein n=1 Tax=Synechococcus sp. M16CYN TaxID=3103139 RepID=UPI0033418249
MVLLGIAQTTLKIESINAGAFHCGWPPEPDRFHRQKVTNAATALWRTSIANASCTDAY